MSDAKLQNPNRNRIVAWAEYNEAQRLPSRENSSLFFKTSAVNVGLRWRSTQPTRASLKSPPTPTCCTPV